MLSQLHGIIAYSFDTGIWVSNADGTDARQLTSDGGFDPTWSADASQIAYRRLEAADDGEIWIMNADGSDQHDLVNDPHFSDWGPAWSRDDSRIAYSSNMEISGLAVWVMNSDGTQQHALTPGHGEYPTWSPDGTEIAYAGGDYYDIRVIAADGTTDRAIIDGPAYDMAPAWSADGEWIAYETQSDYYPAVTEQGQGNEMEIHLVRPDGTDDTRITSDRIEDGFPCWSPVGDFVMWARHGDLVVARPGGSGMVTIGHGNFPDWHT